MNLHGNPYSQMLISTVPNYFFGRRTESEFLLHGVTVEEAQSFTINGPKKIGKTTLLQYLRHPEGASKQYSNFLMKYWPGLNQDALVFIYHDAYKQQGEQLLTALLNLLARTRELTEPLSSITDIPDQPFSEPKKNREILNRVFEVAADNRIRLVVCVDNFDEAYKSFDTDTDYFVRTLASRHSFIFVTIKGLSSLVSDRNVNSPLLSILKAWTLKTLSAADAEDLVTRPASEANLPFAESDIQQILRLAGNHPYLLTLVCDFLFSLHMENPALQKLIPSDKNIQKQLVAQLLTLPAVHSFFQLIWGQLNENEQRVLKQLAQDEQPHPRDPQVFSSLTTVHHLASIDFTTGKYRLFCDLFKDFLSQPKRSNDDLQQILHNISGYDRKLLEYLTTHPNQLCSFEEISREVWGEDKLVKRAIEASIHRLRSLLGQKGLNPDVIQNIRRQGYQFIQ